MSDELPAASKKIILFLGGGSALALTTGGLQRAFVDNRSHNLPVFSV